MPVDYSDVLRYLGCSPPDDGGGPVDVRWSLTERDGWQVHQWDRPGDPPTQADLDAVAASPEYAAWVAVRELVARQALAAEAQALAASPAPIPLAAWAGLELARQGVVADRAGDARREARTLALLAAVRRIESHLSLSPHPIPDEVGVPAEPQLTLEQCEAAVRQIVAARLGLPPMQYEGE